MGDSRFRDLGIPVRKAGFKGCLIVPDETGQKELLYFNFNQGGDRLFLLSVDPDTGQTRQYPAPEGPGAWAFSLGPDGKVYLGTWDGGLILSFDPKNPDAGIRVVGKPSETESYIWMYALGGDGKLYGCTYGNAKLISYDPATGKMKDLGRMHPTQMYSRTAVAGKDGRIYVGIGTVEGDIVVYDPFTGKHKSIVPADLKAKAKSGSTMVGKDGHAYAQIAEKWFRCEDGKLVEVESFPGSPEQRFRDGRVLQQAGNGFYEIRSPEGRVERKEFAYEGSGIMIFHVAEGPLGRIYGSSYMPLELFEYDPSSDRLKHLGNPTPVNGEIYSMTVLDDRLYVCAYPGSWLSVYDPTRPWDYGTSPESNPRGIGYAGDGHLRPRAMIVGPDEKIYIGSYPPYGEHGGALGVYDPVSNEFIENYRHLVPNQSIATLAYDKCGGLVFGGTSTQGGGGTVPVEKEAHLFAWDPSAKEKVMEIVPVPGDGTIRALAVVSGKIFGVSSPSRTLFAVEGVGAEAREIERLPGGVPDLCLSESRGILYGITGSKVYEVDPDTERTEVLAEYDGSITAGFAVVDETLYFASNSHLVCFKIG